jgi:hypothetical protein
MADMSAQALQELRQQLNDAAKGAATAHAATVAAAAVGPADFCSAYKTAKPILQLATTLLPVFLPGLGTTIAAAITALIAVGDKACPGT